MENYLYSIKLTKDILGDESRNLKYLKGFINHEKKLDIAIKDKFPISYFGDEKEKLRIKGSKALIEGFDKLDSEKYDFMEKFKDVRFVGLSDTKEIILDYPNQNIEAKGMYNFSTEFLNQFQLGKYVKFCIGRDYIDIIKTNIDELLIRDGEKEKQYRLLKDKSGEWCIRGITSNTYKNYDNSIALYLSLLALHKYAKEKDRFYYVDKSYISDSYLYVFFEQEIPMDIPKIGKVYLGLAVSNGEIRNNKFSAEVRYRIEDPKKQLSFSAIFTTPIFSIVHNMSILTIETHLNNLFKLDEHEKSVIQFITELYKIDTLTNDAVYFLLKDLLEKISDCSDISKKTKDSFKEIETNNMITNTLTLIEFFGKINTISTDMDEKIFVERIFHEVMLDLLKNRKENG